jgi:hypothetical protein
MNQSFRDFQTGIEGGKSTFETTVPTAEAWNMDYNTVAGFGK